MELLLERGPSFEDTTLGTLMVDDLLECFTLEDQVRVDDPNTPDVDEGKKVHGETAIPAGRYKVIIDFSQRFQKLMLHVLDVPNFTGIRIHSGNTEHDTLGCVLVGKQVDSKTRISGGSIALPVLFSKIEAALEKGEEVWIEIKNAA